MKGSLTVKNGKYYLVLSWYDDDGRRKQKWVKTGLPVKNNKRKAEELLKAEMQKYAFPDAADQREEIVLEHSEDAEPVIAEKSNPQRSDTQKNRVMFTDVVQMWLSEAKQRVRPTTAEGYTRMAEKYVLPYFREKCRDFPIAEAKLEYIQAFIDFYSFGKTHAAFSPKTIRHFFIVINQTFFYACRNGFARDNPCKYVILPKMNHRDPTYLNEKQLNAFFAAIKEDPMYPLIFVTVFFGLRRSEVLGLKWDSIDFVNKTVTIRHTVVKSDTQGLIEQDTTKTASSHRTYPLTPALEDLFRSLKAAETANRKKFGDLYIENDYIFKWDYGKLYAPDFVTRHFKLLLKKAGMPEIRFHDLRHSCASLLVSKGFKMKDVQEWLGHADISTTANIYAHLDRDRKEKIAASMDFHDGYLFSGGLSIC